MPPKTSWEERHKKNIKLSDDEKTILRNIRKSWITIGRKLGGALYLGEERGIDSTFEDFFTGVFEWIPIGKEYKISDLLGDE